MDGATGFDMTIADRVRSILAAQALVDITAVTPDARLADLGLDSLGLVESLFAIEEAFDISVPFNANAGGANAGEANPGEQNGFDLSTVAALIAGVEGLIAAR
jgi:acyl carrier protein